MTQELTPNTQITQENVELLKAGDWVADGLVIGKLKGLPDGWGCATLIAPNGSEFSRILHRHRFTYIGPDLGDGWIGAPEGGWSDHPVPGMKVHIRQDGWESRTADSAWDWNQYVTAFRPALSPPAEGEVNEKADLRQALNLAIAYLGQWEPNDSRAVSSEYVAMLSAGTPHHNAECRQIIGDALAHIEANPLPSIVTKVVFSDPDDPTPAEVPFSAEDACLACNSPAPVDHIGDATEKVDWARCQRCGGEIQGWICQQCHQEFEENDAGELVFCPSEGVDWERVGPKLVVIIQAIAEISGDRAAPGFNEAGRLFRINQRAHEALAAAQPEVK